MSKLEDLITQPQKMVSNEDLIKNDIAILIKAIMKLLAKEGDIEYLDYPKMATNRLYRLYSFDRTYQEDIWEILALKTNPSLRLKYEDIEKKFAESISLSERLCEEHDGKILKISYVKPNFYCHSLPDIENESGAERIYFNPRPDKLHEVVELIINSWIEYNKKIGPVYCHFKFWSIPAIGTITRCDKVVLYCWNKEFLKYFISQIGAIKHIMNDDIPRLTYKLEKGVGYAKDPSAENVAWTKDDDASFGSFISLVIARYLKGFYNNYKQEVNRRAKEYKEMFEKGTAKGKDILSNNDAIKLAERIYSEFKSKHSYEFSP